MHFIIAGKELFQLIFTGFEEGSYARVKYQISWQNWILSTDCDPCHKFKALAKSSARYNLKGLHRSGNWPDLNLDSYNNTGYFKKSLAEEEKFLSNSFHCKDHLNLVSP